MGTGFGERDMDSTLFVQLLGRDALLVSWEGAGLGESRRLVFGFEGRQGARSYALATLPLTDGSMRHVVALGAPRGAKATTNLAIFGSDNRRLASGRIPEFDRSGEATLNISRLVQGCASYGRLRLARFIVEAASATLRLDRDRIFLANVRELIEALCQRPGRAFARADVAGRWILGDGVLPSGFGQRLTGVLLSGKRLRILAPAPARDETRRMRADRTAFNFLMPAETGRSESPEMPALLLFGEQGMAWRRIIGLGSPLPSALEALDPEAKRLQGARRYVLEALAKDRVRRAQSAIALRELELAGSAEGARQRIGLDVDTAVATKAGLFIAGLFADSAGLAAALEFRAPNWAGATTIAGLHHAQEPASGKGRRFVALIAGEGTLPAEARIDVTIRLASGTGLGGGTVLASARGQAAAREIAAALPASAGMATIAEALIPALDAIDMERSAPVDTVDIGERPGAPRAEILAVYPGDPMVRAGLFSSLALDPAMREMALGFVLRDPDERGPAEGVLRTAHAVYGLAFRLYVPPAPLAGVAGVGWPEEGVLNAIIGQAAPDLVILMEAGLIPDSPGWACDLLAALEGDTANAAVSGIVIDSDGTIRHAGHALTRPADGLPEIERPLAGFPAGLADLCRPATADALPAACLAVRRQAFVDVGGFVPGYLTRVYRDADLSLRLRAAGFDLACGAAPAMVAFGADDATNGDEARVLADRQRFARRWSAWLDGASGDPPQEPRNESEGRAPEGEPVVRFRRRRWAA